MNMNQRALKILKEWAILAVLLVILHVVFFGGWHILNQQENRSTLLVLLLTAVYMVTFAVIGLVIYKRMVLADNPLEYREARDNGVPATAKVLNIKRTRWQLKRHHQPFRPAPHSCYEHQMRLRISRPGQADYEALMAEFIEWEDVPKKGAIINIKVHPQRPDVVVLDKDQSVGSKQ